MKKCISLFLPVIITILFSSCGGDNDEPIQPDGEKYLTTFNISGFDIISESANFSNPGEQPTKEVGLYLQYAIYRENGTLLINKTISKDESSWNEISPKHLQIEEELPIGKYHIAVLVSEESNIFPIFSPKSFHTDICLGNRWKPREYNESTNICFESLSYEVNEEIDKNKLNIVLAPMWSKIIIDVKNAATCDTPENTVKVGYSVTPLNYGFRIKDKKLIHKYDFLEQLNLSYDSFRAKEKMVFSSAGSENATIKVVLSSDKGKKDEYEIYRGALAVGKTITLEGVLPEASEPSSSGFKITVKELEYIEIPFTE